MGDSVRKYGERRGQRTDENGAIRHVAGGGAAAVLLSIVIIGGAPAQADGFGEGNRSGGPRYTFTTLLDSQRDGLEPTRCAAINTLGTVAVTVRDNLTGSTRIITKRGARDLPVVVADTEAVADFPTFCDNGFSSLPSDPSINELGEVAFQGNLRRLTTRAECATPEQRARRQGVFLGEGGPLTTIAHTINPPGGDFIAEFLVADQSVNYVRQGRDRSRAGRDIRSGPLRRVEGRNVRSPVSRRHPTRDGFNFNNLSSRVSLNELGQIAFESGLNDSSSAESSSPTRTARSGRSSTTPARSRRLATRR